MTRLLKNGTVVSGEGLRREDVLIDGGVIVRTGAALTEPADDAIKGTVYSVQPAGSETIITVKIGNSTILVKDLGINNFDMDQTVYLRYSHEKANVFHKQSGKLIKKVILD